MFVGLIFVIVSLVATAADGQAISTAPLPSPSGRFIVGRTVLLWTDHTRHEEGLPQADVARELAAFLYYPADARTSYADYYPGLADLKENSQIEFLKRQFGSVWPTVAAGAVRSRAYVDAPFFKGTSKFPVLLFSPGAGAPLAAYSVQLEEISSHGYVVVGLEHAYDSSPIVEPGGRLIPFVSRLPEVNGPPTLGFLRADLSEVIRWTSDARFALDQIEQLSRWRGSRFFRRLDLARIGVFGHSMGGKAAARVCQIDARVLGCVNQDGEIFGVPFGESEPVASVIPGQSTKAAFLDIYIAENFTDAQLAAVHVTRRQYDDWRALKTRALREYLTKNTKPTYLVTLTKPGFIHGSFMDTLQLRARVAGNDASAAQSNLAWATTLTRAFFDARLKNKSSEWNRLMKHALDGVSVEMLAH